MKRFCLVESFVACLLLLVATGLHAEEISPCATTYKASSDDDAVSQYRLARQLTKGQETPRDLAGGAEYLRKSADMGYAPAQTDLGAAYANGSGVKQDYTEATKWYRKAAEQGDPLAQYTLGRIYLIGRGVPKDAPESVRWLRRASEADNGDAMLALGDVYLNGADGINIDFPQAFNWFEKAVARGRIGGLNSLGFLYEHGSGVPRNLQRAVDCYREAAEKADPRGQMNLGRMYLDGLGVEPDPVEAYKWFRLALRNGELVARHYLVDMEMREVVTSQQAEHGEQKVQEYLSARKTRAMSESWQTGTASKSSD